MECVCTSSWCQSPAVPLQENFTFSKCYFWCACNFTTM